MSETIPPQPPKSFRVTLVLSVSKPRLDQVLIEYLRKQTENQTLKNLTRTGFKTLFKNRKVQIKGQIAIPSSALAAGTTYVDILE